MRSVTRTPITARRLKEMTDVPISPTRKRPNAATKAVVSRGGKGATVLKRMKRAQRMANAPETRMDFPRSRTGPSSFATHIVVRIERRVQCETMITPRDVHKLEHRCRNKSLPGRTACGVHGGGSRLAAGTYRREPRAEPLTWSR